MGLDLYAGTLTRYYTHNWKTVTQQWAEQHGFSFRQITPGGGEVEEAASPAEVQAAVESWRDQVLAAITPPGQAPYIPWPEDNEKPYYTDKPDWAALGAMLLVAACLTYGEPVPPTVKKGWDYTEHPAIRRLTEDKERVWSLFRDAVWWLPLADGFFFQGPLPNGSSAVIGTVGGLRMELEQLNRLAWQADEDTILGWTDAEGYPADAELSPDGAYRPLGGAAHTQYDTQSLAKYAFSIFYRAIKFSEAQQVPILMDY